MLMNNGGMTLMEVLAALLVLTLLVTAMGTGLNLAAKIQEEALFASESAALADILQTALADVLGFGSDIRAEGDSVRFSSSDYGLGDGQLVLADGLLCLRESGGEPRPLVGEGAYGTMKISQWKLHYIPRNSVETVTLLDGTAVTPLRGGLFYISFRIESPSGLCRDYETVVRLVNP